ncbi:hypothetical protein ASPFODRAFT_37501 [Aspergillus luchuensis CBS 106.47]|uniref:Uncharacterized protein n=1 Tax=Aspergillus luchuensis (strain CBS 106.47) TaxID=1137211 RepID=A0A1M3T4Q2_ASPLC|nr:hypothetical protein ASPFODRAFT_37501 [Aspergillus luchuensis CBS 106.47]
MNTTNKVLRLPELLEETLIYQKYQFIFIRSMRVFAMASRAPWRQMHPASIPPQDHSKTCLTVGGPVRMGHLVGGKRSAERAPQRLWEKCFFELTILGAPMTYGQAQRLWRVKTGIPTLENLIDVEDLKLQIPTENEEEE